MYIILWIIIVLFSGILSFISSGIEHLIQGNSTSWQYISIGYYFFVYCMGLYIFYRVKFKNPSVLKFFFLRNILKLNSMFHKIDSRVYSEKIELNPLQDKSIKIWNTLIKDKSSTLSSNLITYDRTIQRGGLLAVLKTNHDSTLTIIDNESLNLYCEVYIPQIYKNEMTDLFDRELDRRMTIAEIRKRSHIESLIANIQ